jgi:hypothetical protein
MPVIELSTSISAPVERVFDLARSIDLHTNSTSSTGERAVAEINGKRRMLDLKIGPKQPRSD